MRCRLLLRLPGPSLPKHLTKPNASSCTRLLTPLFSLYRFVISRTSGAQYICPLSSRTAQRTNAGPAQAVTRARDWPGRPSSWLASGKHNEVNRSVKYPSGNVGIERRRSLLRGGRCREPETLGIHMRRKWSLKSFRVTRRHGTGLAPPAFQVPPGNIRGGTDETEPSLT